MSEIEIKPSAKGDFLKSIKIENERPAEILKNRQPKAISWKLSQKNNDGNILLDFIIPFIILPSDDISKRV